MAPPPPVPMRVPAEDLRLLIKWDVLDSIVEFLHEALLHVEAAFFLLGRRMPHIIHESRACPGVIAWSTSTHRYTVHYCCSSSLNSVSIAPVMCNFYLRVESPGWQPQLEGLQSRSTLGLSACISSRICEVRLPFIHTTVQVLTFFGLSASN